MDFIWKIINIIGLLFATFFNPSKPLPDRKESNNTYKTGSSGSTSYRGSRGGANVRGMDVIRNKGGDCATAGG